MNPAILPCSSCTGSMTRSRNRSMSVPREDGLATPGGLDLVVAVAEAAQVVGERGPSGRGVPDVPFGGDGGADAAAVRGTRVPSCRRAGQRRSPGRRWRMRRVSRSEGPARPGGCGRLAAGPGVRPRRAGRDGGRAAAWPARAARRRPGRGRRRAGAVGVPGDAGGGGGDAVSRGQDGCGGLGARVACRPSWPGARARPAAVTPCRAVTMKATESASALRSPVQPEVVVPGGGAGAVVEQDVAELVRQRPGCPGRRRGWAGRRMRRAAQNVVPSAGAPCSCSTANPSRRASQRSASSSPAGAWPCCGEAAGTAAAARWSATGPRRRRPGSRPASPARRRGLSCLLRRASGAEGRRRPRCPSRPGGPDVPPMPTAGSRAP